MVICLVVSIQTVVWQTDRETRGRSATSRGNYPWALPCVSARRRFSSSRWRQTVAAVGTWWEKSTKWLSSLPRSCRRHPKVRTTLWWRPCSEYPSMSCRPEPRSIQARLLHIPDDSWYLSAIVPYTGIFIWLNFFYLRSQPSLHVKQNKNKCAISAWMLLLWCNSKV